MHKKYSKVDIAVYIILIWYSFLAAWVFLDLAILGEIVIREPRVWLRTIELFLALGIFGFALGVFYRFIKKGK